MSNKLRTEQMAIYDSLVQDDLDLEVPTSNAEWSYMYNDAELDQESRNILDENEAFLNDQRNSSLARFIFGLLIRQDETPNDWLRRQQPTTPNDAAIHEHLVRIWRAEVDPDYDPQMEHDKYYES